ncbi:hypothetical protein BH11ARM2_BH11ARM2_22170 [soil metagenome]
MALPLTLGILAALLGQSGWKTYAPKGEIFSAKFPSAPQTSKQTNSEAGYTVDTRMFRSLSANGVFQVVLMRPNGKADAAFRKALITGFKGGLLRSSGGKETSTTQGKLGPYPGTNVKFNVGVNKGEYWAIQSKGEVYILVAVAPPAKFAAQKATFFNSFKLY